MGLQMIKIKDRLVWTIIPILTLLINWTIYILQIISSIHQRVVPVPWFLFWNIHSGFFGAFTFYGVTYLIIVIIGMFLVKNGYIKIV
jgi:hypothetical protein